jgi:hypothetical protein
MLLWESHSVSEGCLDALGHVASLQLGFHALGPTAVIRRRSDLVLQALHDGGGQCCVSIPDGATKESGGLEVSDGWALCAPEELLAVGCEALLEDRQDLVPDISEPLVGSCTLVKRLPEEGGSLVQSIAVSRIFDKVDERVDAPSGHRVRRVVAVTDAKAAQDGVALRDAHAVLFPDWHAAKGQCTVGRPVGDVLELVEDVLVGRVRVAQQGANGFSATATREVVQFSLSLHCFLFYF